MSEQQQIADRARAARAAAFAVDQALIDNYAELRSVPSVVVARVTVEAALGYLIGHVGFLLVNWSWRNFAVLAVLYAAQVLRMHREEAMLARNSADYRQYQRRVRWRLLPFVY